MFQKWGTPKAFLRHTLWCTVLSEWEVCHVILLEFQV